MKAHFVVILSLSFATNTAFGQVIIPRFEGGPTPDEVRWVRGLEYKPSDSPEAWLSGGILIIAHVERFNSADVYAPTCGGTGLYAVLASGTGVARPLAVGAPACGYALSHHGAAIDPTGTWGVFSAPTPPNNSALMRLDLRTGLVDSIPTGCAVYIMSPAVSPNGRQIAVQGLCRTRDSEYELYVMEADGSGLRRLGPVDSVSSKTPSWSPDGEHLAFVRTSHFDDFEKQNYDIVVADTGARSIRRIASGHVPSWSPTGEWIAYLAAHPRQRGEYELRLVRPDGSDDRLLYRNETRTVYYRGFGARTEGEIGGRLVWSPDGRELAFSRSFDRESNVWIVTLENGRLRQVTGTKREQR